MEVRASVTRETTFFWNSPTCCRAAQSPPSLDERWRYRDCGVASLAAIVRSARCAVNLHCHAMRGSSQHLSQAFRCFAHAPIGAWASSRQARRERCRCGSTGNT